MDVAADAENHEEGGGGEAEEEAQVEAGGAHAEGEGEEVADGEVEKPVGDEGDGHDYLDVLKATEYAHRDVLQAVGQLIERCEYEQVGGYLDDFGVSGEHGRDDVAHGDEDEGGDGVPHQNEMVGGFGGDGKLVDVAASEAVRHAYGGGRADGDDYHEGAVAEGDAYLVGTHGFFAKPSHHDADADKG